MPRRSVMCWPEGFPDSLHGVNHCVTLCFNKPTPEVYMFVNNTKPILNPLRVQYKLSRVLMGLTQWCDS